MVSATERPKRALVTLLKSLATAYGLVLTQTRDSPNKDVRTAYRKVSPKTHPDRGGRSRARASSFGVPRADRERASRRHMLIRTTSKLIKTAHRPYESSLILFRDRFLSRFRLFCNLPSTSVCNSVSNCFLCISRPLILGRGLLGALITKVLK